jgi:hypothetical protein
VLAAEIVSAVSADDRCLLASQPQKSPLHTIVRVSAPYAAIHVVELTEVGLTTRDTRRSDIWTGRARIEFRNMKIRETADPGPRVFDLDS